MGGAGETVGTFHQKDNIDINAEGHAQITCLCAIAAANCRRRGQAWCRASPRPCRTLGKERQDCDDAITEVGTPQSPCLIWKDGSAEREESPSPAVGLPSIVE